MHQDVVALLALQTDDDVVNDLEARAAAFGPQVEQLNKQLGTALSDQTKATQDLEAGEKYLRDLQTKYSEQKQLHDRSLSQLDAVRKPREAAAAMTQAEVTRRFLVDMEKDIQTASAQVAEFRSRLAEKDATLEEMKMTQVDARGEIESQLTAIKGELGTAREKRNVTSQNVPRPLLAKYDRLRQRRKETSLFAVIGGSCGNCDMALPIQRRNMMSASGAIDACEACGVLLYVGE